MEQIIALGIAAITGVGWFSGKIFNRMRTLEDRIDRMPLESPKNRDFIRKREKMNEEVNQINIKLDKLVEKILFR